MKKFFRIYQVSGKYMLLHRGIGNWFYTLELAETHVAHLIKTEGGAYSILTIYEKLKTNEPMTNKLTALLLALLITILFSGFYKRELKPSKGIKFGSFSSERINDTLCITLATVNDGENDRVVKIDYIIKKDSVLIKAVVPAYFFNYSKTFTAAIHLPIKF